jgi:polyhydroxyalkanoate synthesis regulator phasin
MAQPRKPTTSKSARARSATRSKPRTKPAPGKSAGADQGAGVKAPGDLVVLTRERIQELFDDAVDRGRMTRDDASELVGELLRRGRRQSGDLIADLEQLLGRSREGLEDVGRRAKRVAGMSSFPIEGYDDLTAAKVTAQLDGLTPAELRKVRDYERRNANRKSALAAIEQKLK